MTDPERTPDPVAAAARLPPGSGVVLRHFGRLEAEAWAAGLAKLARARRLTLLIATDPALARLVGAGLHLPERQVARLPRLHAHFPLVSASAHSPAAVRRAFTLGADAVFLSAAFPSRSPSAGAPLGPVRLAAIARRAPGPVFALGGVNGRTARRLIGTGAAGFAAVEGLSGL